MRAASADPTRQYFAVGRSRWPTLSLDYEVFLEHCARVHDPEQDANLEAADLYLCCACAQGEPSALRLFEELNASIARAAIRRIDPSESFVRDVLQELWARLLVSPEAKVRFYSGRGPVQAWVRVAATRLALDRRRSARRDAQRYVALSDGLADAALSPEGALLKARFGPSFQEALQAAVLELTKQERNVLRMHVSGGCSIDEIGRAYDVHRATAARWIERARTAIYDRVRAALGAKHRLSDSEFRSLAGLMRAELELSLLRGSSSARLIARGEPES